MAASRLSTSGTDVTLGNPDDMLQVAECLNLKGFCVVDSSQCRQLTTAARKDVEALPKSRFARPPAVEASGDDPKVDIADGLLGSRGSNRVLELKSQAPTQALRELDAYAMKLSEKLGSFVAPHGFAVSSRTPAIVHEASDADASTPPPLSAEHAAKWMEIHANCRFMVLFFLGPDKGSLELGVYGQESKTVFKVPTGPDVMVILRTDVISRQHIVQPGKGFVFSCFMLSDAPLPKLPPYAAALSDYIVGRIRDLKDSEIAEGLFLEEVPRSWTRLMSTAYLEGQQVSVRGASCKLPGPNGWNPDCCFLDSMVGPDYVVEIPSYRFDLAQFYYEDPAEELWMEFKTYSKHASFTEGADLFDNKIFSVSAQSVPGFPLNERFNLEVGYEAIFEAGYTKNKLQRLKADVLIGTHMTENQLVQQVAPLGIGSLGSVARDANFLSFALNLMGQSIVYDTDGASSLTAMWQGYAEQCDESDMTRKSAFSLASSAFVNVHPAPFANFCCRRMLTPTGRCAPMDASASGFVRAEACVAMVLRRLHANVDDPAEAPDYGLGLLRGVDTLQYGKGAVLTAPAGAVMQEVMSLAVHSAGVYPSDVDVVECHAHGSLACDAVEANAIAKVFRGGANDAEDDDSSVLSIVDHKGTFGSAYPTAGLIGVLRVMFSSAFGIMPANNMLRILNSYVDAQEKSVQMLTEPCAVPMNATGFSAVNSFGGCGSYCSAVIWVDSHRALRSEEDAEVASKVAPLVFWPGGGGELEEGATPSDGYYISGTFNNWTNATKMTEEGKGEYVAVIELGDNRWEEFQVWLDGDDARVLHPGDAKASRHVVVLGPHGRLASAGSNWLIDGRPLLEALPEGDDEYGGFELKEKANRDRGEPGARFRVRLQVAGKYRTVDWEPLPEAEAVGEVVTASPSTYYLAASWNKWRLEEMLNDAVEPDLWFSEVLQKGVGGEFAIVRNRDWSQKFYPERVSGDSHAEILGPDNEGSGFNWSLCADPGDFFRIEFRRSPGGADGRNVSWVKKGTREVDPALLVEERAGYSLLGSWDGFLQVLPMTWDGSGYTRTVRIGETGCESFQIALEEDVSAVYHPSVPDASQEVPHFIDGPSSRSSLAWTIGLDPRDVEAVAANRRTFQVKVYLSEGIPTTMEWWSLDEVDEDVAGGREAAE